MTHDVTLKPRLCVSENYCRSYCEIQTFEPVMACPALTFLIHCIQSICLYNTAKSRSAAPQTESIHSAEMIPQPFQHKRNIITFTKGGLLFTITGDLFPGVWRVHEGSVVDLVVDILVLIERECPTQADVHNDTDRPHVQ